MSVSGLGSTRTPHTPVAPAASRPQRAERSDRNDFDHLTAADRDLIQHVTGQRLAPGFDPSKEATTGFAAALAAERATHRLAPGQPVTAVYLKDLNKRYERAGGVNPVSGHLAKALDHLAQNAPRGFDVSA